MGTVLLVSVEGTAFAEVRQALRGDGHRVLDAAPGQVEAGIRAHAPGLILVTAPYGGSETYEVCRAIRGVCSMPILVLARAGDEVDELMAFASGADDYVRFPNSIRVVRARVGALLRRSASVEAPRAHVVGNVVIDTEMRQVSVDGVALHLTRIEFELLVTLAENRHRVVPRAELIQRVWGPWPGDDHVVEVHLSRMRNKILSAGGPRLGEPSPGYGYRLGDSAARAV